MHIRNSRSHTFAVRGNCGCAVHPTILGVWSTQWVPGRPGLHRETSTQRKTSENKWQQKSLISKRSLIRESVCSVLMTRQYPRMPTTQLWRKVAETSRLLEKVVNQESDMECLNDGKPQVWLPPWMDRLTGDLGSLVSGLPSPHLGKLASSLRAPVRYLVVCWNFS